MRSRVNAVVRFSLWIQLEQIVTLSTVFLYDYVFGTRANSGGQVKADGENG